MTKSTSWYGSAVMRSNLVEQTQLQHLQLFLQTQGVRADDLETASDKLQDLTVNRFVRSVSRDLSKSTKGPQRQGCGPANTRLTSPRSLRAPAPLVCLGPELWNGSVSGKRRIVMQDLLWSKVTSST